MSRPCFASGSCRGWPTICKPTVTGSANQLWEQLRRYYPQMLKLSSAANEDWLWDLLEICPPSGHGRQAETGEGESDSAGASHPPHYR